MKNNRLFLALMLGLVLLAAGGCTDKIVNEQSKDVQKLTVPVESQTQFVATQALPVSAQAQSVGTQATQLLLKSDNGNLPDFKYDEKNGYYGTLALRGYAVQKILTEPFCEKDCKKFTYVYFNLLSGEAAKYPALVNFLHENEGNADAGPGFIGLGCLEKGKTTNQQVINYENDSDVTGMKEYTIPIAEVSTIIKSTKVKPVTLRLTRNIFTGGSGAPACYSHFSVITLGE